MKILNWWYKRPVTVATILGIIIAIGTVLFLDVEFGPSGNQGRNAFSIIINHYGIDSSRIEREITTPLENELSIISGIEDMSSTSEFGKSRINLVLTRNASKEEVYLALRDAVDRVYSTLPETVQKPQIISSSLDNKPVFIVSFKSDTLAQDRLSEYVEQEIKPSYERIEGSGEIETGGGETREIHVLVEQEKAASSSLTLSDIAGYLQKQHILFPVGNIKSFGKNLPVSVHGKLADIDAIKGLFLPVENAGIKTIKEIAEVEYGSREQESISRVNGDLRVILYIQSAGAANLVSLSQSLRKETDRWEKKGFEAEIILDRGQEIEAGIIQVLIEMGIGIVIVVFFLLLTIGHLKQIILLSFLLPFVSFATIAVLSFLRISLDQVVLSGMAVGIGNIIDTGIVLTDQLIQDQKLENRTAAFSSLEHVIPPLVSSTLTTLIVMVPLFFLGETAPGLQQVAIAVTILMMLSFILTILFIPPFFLAGKVKREVKKKRRFFSRFLKIKRIYRFLYLIIKNVIRFKYVYLAGSLVLFICSIFFVLLLGKDFSGLNEPGVVYIHLEFESNASVETSDTRAALLSSYIKNIAGIRGVEVNAKRGSAEMVVHFDPAQLSKESLTDFIRGKGLSLPGDSFVYIPETVSLTEKKIEISLSGDDNEALRELVKQTSSVLGKESWVKEVVLHFKEGPPAWIFYVDNNKAFQYGLNAAAISQSLRWGLHGPVALKWIADNHEIDLRVKAQRDQVSSIREINGSIVQSPDKEYKYLLQLGSFRLESEETRIYHKNRQRSVFFTVHTQGITLDKAIASLWEILHRINLPKAYAFELDKSIAQLNKQFRTLWLLLGLSLLLIYMILASESESLTNPLIICSIVPVSLTFPVIALWVSGQTLTLPVLIGLIIICGMVVNNAILITDEVRSILEKYPVTAKSSVSSAVIYSIRKRLRPLLLTTMTSIIGTLPLLFSQGKEDGLLSSIAFVVFWGSIGSIFASLFFIPALISCLPSSIKSFSSK